MFELIPLTETCYYINSPAKIGLVKLSDHEVCLIDSGNDKDAGRKIRQILENNHWSLRCILNTHSNADHIGGNQYLQRQTGCAIYAPGIEATFTNYPLLEPSFLYGGYPPKDLRHKFLMAQASQVSLEESALPAGLTPIPLPGHFFHMTGFRTQDDVVFLADCLTSQETLEKYQIPFIYDVAAYLDTLEQVKSMDAKLFLPSHAAPTDNIRPLAQYNIDQVHEIAGKILALCQNPLCFEDLLQALFLSLGLEMTFEQYVLAGSTVRSFLSWLKDAQRVTATFQKAKLLWQAVPSGPCVPT